MTRKSFLASLLSAFVVPFRRKPARITDAVRARALIKGMIDGPLPFKHLTMSEHLKQRMLLDAMDEAKLALAGEQGSRI